MYKAVFSISIISAIFELMKLSLTAAFIFLASTLPVSGTDITEDIFAGVPHFIIKTKKATYYLDKEGGGLSKSVRH